MPTYEYKCRTCGHRFEAFQTITEKPVRVCPQCGAGSVERLISAGGGLIFKGSGFYITDYRKESYQREAKQELPETPKSEPKPSAKPGSAGDKPMSGTPSGDK